VWSHARFEELDRHFVKSQPTGSTAYYDKLIAQLERASDDELLLMAELHFLHFLIAAKRSMTGKTKRRRINTILNLMDEPVSIPRQLGAALDDGLVSTGTHFNTSRPDQLMMLIEFGLRWNEATSEEIDQLIEEPWAFHELVMSIATTKTNAQAFALLHLFFPDFFDDIVSTSMKQQIVSALSEHTTGDEQNIDEELVNIRAGLTREYGRHIDSFFIPEIRARWDGTSTTVSRAPEEGDPDLTESIAHPLNLILHGPPGTGKTFQTRERACRICDRDATSYDELLAAGRLAFVTFHQSMSYEDFVEGIRPQLAHPHDTDASSVGYVCAEGVFKQMALVAAAEGLPEASTPEDVTQRIARVKHLLAQGQHRTLDFSTSRPFVLIVDEFNRGTVSRIRGELITLLGPTKRLGEAEATIARLPYSKDAFGVPPNLHIIATMNTADRSIALMDSALRRRFDFIEVMPQLDLVFDEARHDASSPRPLARAILRSINDRLAFLLGREHVVGHASLMHVSSLEEVRDALVRRIIPQVREHFHHDEERFAMVLGHDSQSATGASLLVRVEHRSESLFGSSIDVDDVRATYVINPLVLRAAGEELRDLLASTLTPAALDELHAVEGT